MAVYYQKPFVEERAKSEYHYMMKSSDIYLKRTRQYSILIEPLNFIIDCLDQKSAPKKVKEVVARLQLARKQIIKDYKLKNVHKIEYKSRKNVR